MNENQIEYYAKRAGEYDRIFQRPERQSAIDELGEFLRDLFKDRDIIELACGTGYWTKRISTTATSILATDINEEMLEVARERKYYSDVDFKSLDIFSNDSLGVEDKFNGGFGGFIWSHVPRARLREMLVNLHNRLEKGSPVCFIDNHPIEGFSEPVERVGEDDFQKRVLDNGEEYTIIKNYPEDDELRTVVSEFTRTARVWRNDFYWVLAYEVI